MGTPVWRLEKIFHEILNQGHDITARDKEVSFSDIAQIGLDNLVGITKEKYIAQWLRGWVSRPDSVGLSPTSYYIEYSRVGSLTRFPNNTFLIEML